MPSCCVICILVFALLSLSLFLSLPLSLPLSGKLYFSMPRGTVNKESNCITRNLNNRRKCPKPRKSCLRIDRVRRMFLIWQRLETSSCLHSLHSGIWNLGLISLLLLILCLGIWDGAFSPTSKNFFSWPWDKISHQKSETAGESVCERDRQTVGKAAAARKARPVPSPSSSVFDFLPARGGGGSS